VPPFACWAILFPPETSTLLTVGLPAPLPGAGLRRSSRSTRARYDRGGCPLGPGALMPTQLAVHFQPPAPLHSDSLCTPLLLCICRSLVLRGVRPANTVVHDGRGPLDRCGVGPVASNRPSRGSTGSRSATATTQRPSHKAGAGKDTAVTEADRQADPAQLARWPLYRPEPQSGLGATCATRQSPPTCSQAGPAPAELTRWYPPRGWATGQDDLVRSVNPNARPPDTSRPSETGNRCGCGPRYPTPAPSWSTCSGRSIWRQLDLRLLHLGEIGGTGGRRTRAGQGQVARSVHVTTGARRR
jgi:hypothetical protein